MNPLQDLLVLGPVGSAALIVFVILTGLKVNLGAWWTVTKNNITNLVLSIVVTELLILNDSGPELALMLKGVVAGFIVSLAVQFGHEKFEARTRELINAEITKATAELVKATGGTK